jgi:hypothetical protein
VLDLDADRRLRLPSGTKRIWVEVGCNARDTLSHLITYPENQDVLLVQFEPLLDKFAALLAANTVPEAPSRLGFSGPRTIVLPFAVSPGMSSTVPFHVAALDGCSSLLESTQLEPLEAKIWGHLLVLGSGDPDMSHIISQCQKHAFTTQVPTISLESFFDLVFGQPGGAPRFEEGGDLGGDHDHNRHPHGSVSIEYIKIDAQGFDLQVCLCMAAACYTDREQELTNLKACTFTQLTVLSSGCRLRAPSGLISLTSPTSKSRFGILKACWLRINAAW